MLFKNMPENTLTSQLSMKTILCGQQVPHLKSELKQYFIRTQELYEKLFSIINNEKSFYSKPEPLRHPLIFYYGHTAAFFVNKFIDRGLISQRINESYEQMFAVGVDEMDWDDLNEEHYDWPSITQVKKYRQKVRQMVVDVIQGSVEKQINWKSDLWIVLMGIQHERIHLQTSSVIIRRLPVGQVTQPQWFKECPHVQTDKNSIPFNSLQKVPAFTQEWDRKRQSAKTYGWDNQFGKKVISTKQYKVSKMLVSNGQFLQFVNEGGYQNLIYWSEQGKNWLKSTKVKHPLFWKIQFQTSKAPVYYLRTITRIIQMPWNWPAQVNNLQAQAFCNWKSQKTGKKLRLPTQDQYFAMRNLLKADLNDWRQKSVGNINLEYWVSPNPVDMFKYSNFFDIVGNVWQHTLTPIYPFQDFQIHPNYQDFTTPTFDNRHNIIKGGSFISTGNQALYYSRYAFRRHFYQFAGFRYVQSQNQPQISSIEIDQSDQSVERALQIHFTSQNSYIQKVNTICEKLLRGSNIQRSLVVGCSVGRLPLELSKKVQTSYGIDYSARYFQMATRLLEKKYLKYRTVQIQLQKMNLSKKNLINVHLYQMNPQNTDCKKINDIELMVIDGLSIKPNTLNQSIKNCLKLLSKTKPIYLLVISNNSVQKLSKITSQIFQKSIKREEQILLQNGETIEKKIKLQIIQAHLK